MKTKQTKILEALRMRGSAIEAAEVGALVGVSTHEAANDLRELVLARQVKCNRRPKLPYTYEVAS